MLIPSFADQAVIVFFAFVITLIVILALVRAFPNPKTNNQNTLFILLILVIMFIVTIVISFVLLYLAVAGLIEYPLVVSLVIAEVPIAAFISLLFGEHNRSAQDLNDAIQRAKALTQFKHLEILFIPNKWSPVIERRRYYVVNKRTMLAFVCPRYIRILGQNDIVHRISYSKLDEIQSYFKQHEITLVTREPLAGELDD